MKAAAWISCAGCAGGLGLTIIVLWLLSRLVETLT